MFLVQKNNNIDLINQLAELEISALAKNTWQFLGANFSNLLVLQAFVSLPQSQENPEYSIESLGQKKLYINKKDLPKYIEKADQNKICKINKDLSAIVYKLDQIILGGFIFNTTSDKNIDDFFMMSFWTKIFNNIYQYNLVKSESNYYRDFCIKLEEQNSKLLEYTNNTLNEMRKKERENIELGKISQEKIIYQISSNLAEYQEVEDIANAIVTLTAKEYKLDNCLIILNNEMSQEKEYPIYEYSKSSPIKDQLAFLIQPQELSQLLNLGLPTELRDIEHIMSKHSEIITISNLEKILIVPIASSDKTQGLLLLNFDRNDKHQDNSINFITILVSLARFLGVALTNAYLRDIIKKQAVTDGLTGLYNRRSFDEKFTQEFNRAKRYNEVLSIVVVDLDFLKKINDNYGHKYGDLAIQKISEVLQKNIRSIDIAARYGGEEFVLILPYTDTDMAYNLAQRIRQEINSIELETIGKISASLGLASFPKHADNIETLFIKADEALYEAKKSGRNNVKISIS